MQSNLNNAPARGVMQSARDVVARRERFFSLKCTVCGQRMAPSVSNVRCEACGGTLVIARDTKRGSRSGGVSLVQLGQGGTPTIELARVKGRLGLASLTAKLEYLAPTGSFKDRGSAALITAALEEGVTEFVEDSSGNAGASMAAYAATAGVKAHIFAPGSASSGKLDQIRVFGAKLHVVDGSRQEVTDAAMGFAEEQGIPYLSHALSPWFVEGMRSFAEEALEPSRMPTDVVLPVGNGSLLLAMSSVLGDDREGGDVAGRAAPRIHVVQSVAVDPLFRAIHGAGHSTDGDSQRATVASGISVTAPPRLAEMVGAVRAWGGTAVIVSDSAMLSWRRTLAESEGVFCEVTSAAVLAGLEKLVAEGVIDRRADVLVPITGSGLKEPL